MFLLSNSILGQGVFSNTPPVNTEYEKISVYGNCVIDGLHILDYELDDTDILEVTTAPAYGANTILCANFENTLEAGSVITSVPYLLTGYVIRRKIKNDSLNPILSTISDPLEVEYTDYTLKNNIEYIYEVTPVFDDGGTNRIEGRGVISEEVFVSYFGYILSDTSATPTTSYTFTIELESDVFKTNKGFKLFENHTKFPAYRSNSRNYLSGSLSTIPLDDDLEVSETLLQEIIDFINDDTEKILRTPSGRILKVVTMNPTFKYMDKIQQQPATLKFDFVEIGEVT